ncbi:MAG TPA: PQQ-binding-like beta-propeller repeat protein [Polyangiales bacterium]|nr:PQQ-binding-like beta-propeller repeat protein [Polyangiales bacterium]
MSTHASDAGHVATSGDASAGATLNDAGAKPGASMMTAPRYPGSANWTMQGGDTRNTFSNFAETQLNPQNARQLKQKWAFTVAGFPPGSPVVVDDTVYVMATGGTYAINLQDGRERWSRTDIAGTAAVAYADGFVYLHTSRATLYKVDAKDGKTVWGPVRTYRLNSADGTSSPVVALDKVLVGHSCGPAEVSGNADQDVARGGVEAFSIEDGAPIWTYYTAAESGENGAMVWSTVAVDLENKMVFATTGNNYTMGGDNSDAFHAIDLDTGERLWRTQVRPMDVWSLNSVWFTEPTGDYVDTDFGASPILADLDERKLVAAGDKAGSFWALDRMTGEIVWSREKLSGRAIAATGGILANGGFDGKKFYAAVNQPPQESLLRVMNAADGSDVFEPVPLGKTVWGAVSLANGLLLVPANTELRIYDTATDEELVTFETGGTISGGAPVVHDGNVLVQSGLSFIYADDGVSNNQIICYGLDATSKPMEPKSGGTSPNTGAATWSAIYNEVIVAAGCSGAALCHGGGMGLGNLTFPSKQEAYDALVNVRAMGTNVMNMTAPNCKDLDLLRVAPGNPDASLLQQKVSGTPPCGDAMPPGGSLEPAQVQQIRSWIERGAMND